MTPGARLAAAIEVLGSIETERRPAADALKAWGLTHRFAGSGDRAGIAGLVYDALRRRASSAFLMGAETPRAVLLGMLKRERGLNADAIGDLANGVGHAPPPLTDDERQRLDTGDLDGAPPLSLATIRNGSILISSARSATNAPRRAPHSPRARRSTCASIRSPPTATRRPVCCRT